MKPLAVAFGCLATLLLWGCDSANESDERAPEIEARPAPAPKDADPGPKSAAASASAAAEQPPAPVAAAARPPGMARLVSDRCAIRGSKLWCWPSLRGEGKPVATESPPVSVAGPCALLDSGAVICVESGKATVVPGLDDVTALSSAAGKLCAVRSAGVVTCVKVDGTEMADVEGVHDAVDVSMSARHACAILRGGTVSCWGSNDNGQLGTKPGLMGSSKDKPARAVEGVSGAVEVSAGAWHVCVRTEAGDVSCWGSDESRQSSGKDRAKFSPPKVVVSGASAIATGGRSSCAVVSGALTCWGEELDTPMQLPTAGPVQAVSFGRNGCVLLEDERVQCWPEPLSGDESEAPVWTATVPGARLATPGVLGAIVLTEAGTLQFFDPGWTEAIEELGSLDGVAEFDVEGRSLCVVDQSGQLRCWSRGGGVESASSWASDPELKGLSSLAVWRDRGCAITSNGKLACFTPDNAPEVTELGGAVGKLVDTTSTGHRCVAEAKGKLRCFGPNEAGQLGQGHTKPSSNQLSPKKVGRVLEVDADLDYTCARTKKGRVMCWGGEFPHEAKPLAPHDVGVDAPVQIAVGHDIACARDEAGVVSCWRDWVDWDSNPPSAEFEEPATPQGFEGAATDIRMTDNRLCAVYHGGEVRCAALGPLAHKSFGLPTDISMAK